MLTYENGTGTPGLLVFRDESQTTGSDVLGGKGTFDDAAYWTMVSDPVGATDITGGKLVFTAAVSGNNFVRKEGILTTGKTYKIVWTIDSISGASASLRVQAGATAAGRGASRTAAGTYTDIIVATGTDFYVAKDGAGTVTAVVDNVTVTEVAEMTYDVDLAALSTNTIGLDLTANAWKMYVGGGSPVATLTGTGALGAELVSPIDLTSGWTASGSTINTATQFTNTGFNGATTKANVLTIGRIYQAVTTGSTTAGTLTLRELSGVASYGPIGTTFIFTAVATGISLFNGGGGAGAVNSNVSLSIKEIPSGMLAQPTWQPTIYLGSSTTSTLTLNGSITALHSSNDPIGSTISLIKPQPPVYLVKRKRNYSLMQEAA
jgi:hypothetical protein